MTVSSANQNRFVVAASTYGPARTLLPGFPIQRKFSATRDSARGSRHEQWMTTIVDLDTGRVLGVLDRPNHKGVSYWLWARPLAWRLSLQVQDSGRDEVK